MKTTKLYIVIAVLILLLGFALGWFLNPTEVITTGETTTITTAKDTVYTPLTVYRDTTIVKVKYKVIDKSRIDTIKNEILAGLDSTTAFPVSIDSSGLYLTPAFEFEYSNISTTTKDTHEVKFYFPNKELTFTEKPSPKLTIYEKVKETITVTLEKPLPWYKQDWFQYTSSAVLFIGGGYLGYKLGGK